MLLRYPGNGNSIPSLRTVATSVPVPPTGPPPAFGASVFLAELSLAAVAVFTFCAAEVFASVGVTALAVPFVAAASVREVGGALASLRLGTDASRIVDGAVVAWVTGVVGFAAPDRSSPMARSPGGAATMLTRYIGGNATGFCSFRL